MKRMFLVATMATLMTLTATGSALARGRGPGDGGPGAPHGRGGCMGQALKAANLTPDQQQRLQALRKQQKEKMAPLREQLKAKAAELRGVWQSDSPSRDAILAKHDEMDALRRQLRAAQVDQRLAMFGVLTPEQRAAFRARAQDCDLDEEGHGGHERGPDANGRQAE